MTLFNKSKSQIQDLVKQVKKQVGEEVGELTEHTSKQITGGDVHPLPSDDQNKQSPVVEAMSQTSQPPLTDEEEAKLQIHFIDRTKKLEEEMDKFRKEREAREKEGQENKASSPTKPGEPMLKPLDMPKSKPTRGKMSGTRGHAESGAEVRRSKQ